MATTLPGTGITVDNPRRTVAWALLVTAVIVTGAKLVRGETLYPRSYIGLLAVGMALGALAGPAPQVAAPIAILVLLSTLIAQATTLTRVFNPKVRGPVSPSVFTTALAGDLPLTGAGVGTPVGSGAGTNAVKRFVAAYRARFGKEPAGRICGAGSVACSEHPFCNAKDISASKTSTPSGDQIFAWVLANTGTLAIAHAIWNRQVWSYNSPTVHPYYGPSPHTDHVHVDFLPQLNSCV